MKIMSFNILCSRWENRVTDVINVLRARMPDSFGLQEAHRDWMDAVIAGMPEYDYIGVGRDDGVDGGEFSPVFYRKDKYSVVDSGNFWLNEKVTEPGKGWDAACIRICSYALLKNEENEEIYAHFNTHLDHRGHTAMYEGAKLICSKIAELYPDVHVVLTGDFNVYPQSDVFGVFMDNGMYDTRKLAEDADVRGTFHNFDGIDTSNGFSVIDYILTNDKDAKVKVFKVCHDRPEGRCPSDHDAVYAEIEL